MRRLYIALLGAALMAGSFACKQTTEVERPAAPPQATETPRTAETSPPAKAPSTPKAPETATASKPAKAPAAPKAGTKPTAKAAAGKVVTLPDGLKYEDIVVGTGPEAKPGQTVAVDYVGTLADGTEFDASSKHGGPFEFPLGAGQVIKGWDEGVAGMRVGGKRKLTVPPDLGYGASGTPDGTIPPNSTLIFVVDLRAIK